MKQAIVGAASYNPSKKKGSATWTKNIQAAVQIVDPIIIEGIKPGDVKCEAVKMTSDGKPARFSKGSRVTRRYPRIDPGWVAQATILVLDESIPNEVMEQALGDAGVFVGLGRWRAEKGGLYGRFQVAKKKWS